MAQKQEGLRGIIYERINILLPLAASSLKNGDERHARRYVRLARKLSARYNCRMGNHERALFCKSCGLPSIVGFNTAVRLRKREHAVEYACSCGAVRRFKYP